MSPLNDYQVLFIEERLKMARLQYAPLEEELLDHLCCRVEDFLEKGYSFHEAVDLTFALFSESDLQNIEKQTLYFVHQKSKIMKTLSLMIAGLLMTIPTIFWVNYNYPPTISPLDGNYRISSPFGIRHHPIHQVKKMHKGIDFAAPLGTPVRATAAGIVLKITHDKKGYGNHLVIKHDESYSTLYAQLHDIQVVEGQEVVLGQQIGTVGSSGASTAPHLHYEVLLKGAQQDPEEYLRP